MTIVVGVDGSPGSDAALRWAIAEARLRGVPLRAVTAFQVATLHMEALPMAFPRAPAEFAAGDDVEQIRSAAEDEAKRVLEDALARVGPASDVEIESAALAGAPAATLIEEGRSAELLVVGSRGRGGFAGLLLGSVSQQCAQHPPCPVVILPPVPEPE